jgi:hypothetical protein
MLSLLKNDANNFLIFRALQNKKNDATDLHTIVWSRTIRE